jgi:uncharacterized protein
MEQQGALTPALRSRIAGADTRQALEDLYLPWRPKRRTRATIARERGLEPLADRIWSGEPDDARARTEAGAFAGTDDVPDVDSALAGASDILAERIAEEAEMRGWARERTRAKGIVRSSLRRGADADAASKFRDYFEFSQKLTDIPSHRVLAIRRGEAEKALSWTIDAPVAEITDGMRRRVLPGRRARALLEAVVDDAYARLLGPSIESELSQELRAAAEEEAIRIFGSNLERLLLAAPAGERVVLGLDPGFRTGVKAAVVSRTGNVVETATLMLHQPDNFARGVRALVERHGVELIAIGNGTASRETESLTREVVGGATPLVVVNEAGASVYSASEVAREELPELDVSLRGAASIARRLQDPLAELVKIDARSIGVGQYQHDVDQSRLASRLDAVVEVCVNRVGVDVNTASASLLGHVAGIGPTLARNIVTLRDERGRLMSRRELRDVPRLGAKAFEQAAGFLRIRGGPQPLDGTAVHPERYDLVGRMAKDLGTDVGSLVASEALIERVEPERYVGGDVGLPTLRDIIAELRRPGRDPREAFEPPSFRDDVRELSDLRPGMRLDGVVTNVVAFGAFVDIGVHQDGLVHISKLADRYVKDPAEVVHVGQRVRVTVVDVDERRRRIALSMKEEPTPPAGNGR